MRYDAIFYTEDTVTPKYLSDGREITTATYMNEWMKPEIYEQLVKHYPFIEIMLQDEKPPEDFLDPFQYVFQYSYSSFFDHICEKNSWSKYCLEIFNDYRYEGRPINKLYDGTEITQELILNDISVQYELCHFYGWIEDYVKCNKVEQEAFWRYCTNPTIHLSEFTNKTFAEFYNKYIETAKIV